MSEEAVLVVAAAVLLAAAVSGRIERTPLTSPMLMVGAGLAIGTTGVLEVSTSQDVALAFLELTLALVLFSDAARIDLGRLREEYRWPERMLAIGLPLAMVLGAAAAAWILRLPLGYAALAGVILAPTDAALAEPLLASEELPRRIRQTINVESGLNDGLALPGLLVAVALIEAGGSQGAPQVVLLALAQLVVGLLGGIVLGVAGAWLIGQGTTSRWMTPRHQKIAALAVALVAFAATQLLGGSGFVAAFVAGAVLGARVRPRCEYLYEFTNTEGSTLVLVAFLLLGAGPIRELLESGAGASVWAAAVASLLLVRPLAVLASLVGQKLRFESRLVLGWFGPRGLASVVFLLVVGEETGAVPETVTQVVMATVALSVLLHGLTARPAALWLARRLGEEMPEMGAAYDHPMRIAMVKRPSPDSPGAS